MRVLYNVIKKVIKGILQLIEIISFYEEIDYKDKNNFKMKKMF